MATYANNAQLKKDIIGTARVDSGCSPWMDHFSAVSIETWTDELTKSIIDVEVSASLWEKATTLLNVDERLALLTLITGTKVNTYSIPTTPDHVADRDKRFGGRRFGAEA